MGLVNTVVPSRRARARDGRLVPRDERALAPCALRLLKSSFNATEDGVTGIQQLSHDATLLFYMSEEGQEGRNSFQEGRSPDFSKYPRRPR